MIDYEKLQTELNQQAIYLLNSIKRDYDAYLLGKKQSLINKLLATNNIVVIDSLVKNDKIHLNPNHKIFESNDYDKIKKYFVDNVLLEKILNLLITLHIPEKEFIGLSNPNKNQSCCIDLRKGFISYISEEFTLKNRLVKPEVYNLLPLEFIKEIQGKYLDNSIRRYAFYDSYNYLCEQFYQQTGEDILELYEEFYKNNGIELLDDMDRGIGVNI